MPKLCFLRSRWLRRFPKEIPPQEQNEYRQFFFRSDIAQSRMVLILLTAAIIVFGLSDYLLLGLSVEFYFVELLRLLVVVFSVYVIRSFKTLKNYHSYDKLLFVYLLVFVAFSLYVNTTRPEGYAVQAVILGISIFAFFLALPTRFLNQVALSSIYTVGEITLLFFTMPTSSSPEFIPIVFSVLFANMIAALASWEFNYYRWLVFKDLSQLKKSERFVVIGQTAGMVGHDIRNPLQAITSDLYLIQQELDKNPHCSSADIAESINSINENINYINKIVSDLQDYTRTLTLNIITVRIKDIFKNAVSTVPENITAQINLDPNLSIKTDPTYFKRILTNLVTNAVQAMPNGGRLTLEAQAAKSRILISVIDTGVGIPEEAKPNLFKPLFTTKAKGQGLGLAVVKRLVEALKGSITFESQEGLGTKFILEFPLEQ